MEDIFIIGILLAATCLSGELIFNIEKIISSKNLLSLFSNNLSIYHLDLILFQEAVYLLFYIDILIITADNIASIIQRSNRQAQTFSPQHQEYALIKIKSK